MQSRRNNIFTATFFHGKRLRRGLSARDCLESRSMSILRLEMTGILKIFLTQWRFVKFEVESR
jgi:hypothetical protein